MKKVTSIAGVIASSALAAVLLSSTPAAAYQCKNVHHYQNGHGSHPHMHVARAIAKKSWQNKIKNDYGLAWSVWNIAKGKQLSCFPMANGTKTCVARARPCKYVTG